MDNLGQYELDNLWADESPIPRGSPTTKPRCDLIDAYALFTTFLCFLGCCLVVSPWAAWYLGFTYQIVVIGVFLSIMNVCNRRIASHFFIVSEVHWGKSTLQNLDAIMQQSVLAPNASLVWRAAIFLLMALPVGLSVAYKTFTDGQAGRIVTQYTAGYYGVYNRPMENSDQQTYSLIDAMAPLRRVASRDTNFPNDSDLPLMIGYNLVMLSEEEVVMLDMPNDVNLGIIQGQLAVDEEMRLSADIRGTLARYNSSTEKLLKDDDFWEKYMDRMTSIETYEGWRVALAHSAYPMAWAAVGGYRHPDGQSGVSGSESSLTFYTSDDWNASYVDAFRNSTFSLMFNLYRLPCSVTWSINSSSVLLTSAACNTTETRPVVISMLHDYWGLEDKTMMDALPFAIDQFWDERPSSPWKMPMAAMSAVALWVGRWKHMLHDYEKEQFLLEFNYKDVPETFEVLRHAVNAKAVLYVVFAIQPLLSLAMLGATVWLYSAPVGSGFGLVSILASIKTDSLAIVCGAGLSGELEERVQLKLRVLESDAADQNDEFVSGRIVSELKELQEYEYTETKGIKKGGKYA
ncbi:hypothetical protein B0T10DRAFT_269257 [Thelonectria olida]|uniref:Uncharacterized protein n=1 Tax=Thelonectria olida TaxID=1576542 RepID=A0A9P8WBI4_9HYPO|nr:hypothetical protein B0T10DRAFT_269257 [Thelonectria olida]